MSTPYDIEVRIHPSFTARLDATYLRRLVEKALSYLQVPVGTGMSLVITDEREVQDLNRRFRGVDAPTDVLAFGEGEREEPFVSAPEAPPYLGDVVIAYPRAEAQAAEHGHSVEEEMRLLLVHGILHLLGYDHATPEEKAVMWARQDEVLQAL